MTSVNEIQFQYAAHTVLGKEKQYNTDICEKFDLVNGLGIVICDGVDGVNKEGGALAAKLAVEAIKRHFRKNAVKNPLKALQGAMMLANFMVYDHAMKNERFQQMGVNIMVILVIDGLVFYASVGSNQLLMQREGILYQLVKPIVNESNTTLALLGLEKNARFSLCKNPILTTPGDVLLCATDGLNFGFSDEQIAELLAQDDISVELLSYQIIYKLEELGIADNATVGICRISDPKELPESSIQNTEIPEIQQKKETNSNPLANNRFIIITIIVFVLAITLVVSKYLFTDNSSDETDQLVKGKPTIGTQNQKDTKEGSTNIKSSVPEKDDAKEKSTISEKQDKTQVYTYTLQKGDTFFRIGSRFNVPVKRLEQLNKTNSSQLRFGQKLKIPIQDMHTVTSGETIGSIAKDYKVSKNALIKANQMKNENQLKVGGKLIIPLTDQ